MANCLTVSGSWLINDWYIMVLQFYGSDCYFTFYDDAFSACHVDPGEAEVNPYISNINMNSVGVS